MFQKQQGLLTDKFLQGFRETCVPDLEKNLKHIMSGLYPTGQKNEDKFSKMILKTHSHV